MTRIRMNKDRVPHDLVREKVKEGIAAADRRAPEIFTQEEMEEIRQELACIHTKLKGINDILDTLVS
jgi:hypothetical protein